MTRDFSWLFVLSAILLVRWIAFEAFAERAVRRGEEVLFRPPLGLRLLFGIAMPGLIYAAGAVALTRSSQHNWWLSGMFVGFAVLIAFEWPGDIGVSKSAIYEQKWLRLWKRAVRWEDVDYATADPTDNSVEVVSKYGFKIRHTKYHVGRSDFLAEIKNRCRLVEPGQTLG
jgi:hypothetical protein